MAKARATLLDEVRSGLKDRKGTLTWFEILQPDVRAEVSAIKREWLGGNIATTKTALARSLAKALTARGIQIGHAGVIRWLEKT
jgi:hypothetical protein